MFRRSLSLFLSVTGLGLIGLGMSAVPGSGADKEKITNIDQIPRETFSISTPPSQMLLDEAAMKELGGQVETFWKGVLDKYDIEDYATLQQIYGTLEAVAFQNGEYDSVLSYVDRIRDLEEKDAKRYTTGLVVRAWVQAKRETGAEPDSPEFQKAFRTAYDASLEGLPWDLVMDTLERTKGQMQVISQNLIVGMVAGSLDPAAEKTKSLGSDQATQLVGMRQAITMVIPVKDQVAEALTAALAANKKEKEDIWPAREVTLTGKEGGEPVVVAVWDSGVDVSLFPDQLFTVDGSHGIAYDVDFLPTTGYLMSLGDEASHRTELEDQIEGFFDLQANIDSPAASALRQKMGSLGPDQVKPFIEGLSLYANYAHGTHVAGIASRGNPYARILVSRLTFDYHMIPKPPTMEMANNFAKAVQDAVAYYKTNGVRVVNMSWGYNLKGIEDDLEKNGIGANAEERAKMAREMFGVMKAGMVKAIESAPGILFVAAAGNSDSDATFDEFVPSSLVSPNLLVAGAVDQSGEPTGFTSFGPTVKVYSNGFEVLSYVPGGRKMHFSGTSMASPNVVNLAAKLMAMQPSLTPEDTIRIILSGANPMVEESTVFLLNPKESMDILQREKKVKSDD